MQMLEVRPFPLRTNTEVLTRGRSSPCLRTREKKRLVGRKVGGGGDSREESWRAALSMGFVGSVKD